MSMTYTLMSSSNMSLVLLYVPLYILEPTSTPSHVIEINAVSLNLPASNRSIFPFAYRVKEQRQKSPFRETGKVACLPLCPTKPIGSFVIFMVNPRS